MGPELKQALIGMYKENKGALIHDPLFSMLNHSHPTLNERSAEIDLLSVEYSVTQ
jgi:hypothetical protein